MPAISGKKKLILPFYKSLVRGHLEHTPHLRLDVDKMEKIQKSGTKMIPEIRNHNYHQRIQDLDLISLVQRRLRGQLIEVGNPVHPLNGALPGPYVPVRITRDALVAHRYTYAPPRCRTLQCSRIFIPFSVSLWNDLAKPVFDGVGLAGFKSRANTSLLA